MLEITDRLSIPEEELHFTASRSSGPGGQNVNKVDSRVTLRFDVMHSPSLPEDAKHLIRERLSTRVSKDGILRVVAQTSRSQALNREAVIARFVDLIRGAIKRLPPRKKTRTPKSVRQKRLDEKKHRSQLKQARTGKDFGD